MQFSSVWIRCNGTNDDMGAGGWIPNRRLDCVAADFADRLYCCIFSFMERVEFHQEKDKGVIIY